MRIGRLAVALSAAAIIVTGWTTPASSAALTGPGTPVAATKQLKCPSNATDTYLTTATDSAWGNPLDWSTGKVPTGSDIACIPSGYGGPTVVLGGAPYQVGALDVLNATGIGIANWGLTINDKRPASEATNLGVSDIASLNLSGGKFKLLSGQSTLSGPFNGPGTVTIERKATLLGLSPGQFGDGMSVINKGNIQSGTTTQAGGLGLCQDSASTPAMLQNDGTITIYAHGGVGGCGDGSTNQGTIVNESTGKIVNTYPAGFCSCTSIGAIPTTNDGSIEIPQGISLTVPPSLVNDGTITTAGVLEFFSGNPVLGPSSILGVTLNSRTSNGYFVENVGSLNLGGTLAISIANGVAPQVGDSFVVGYDGYYTGNFVGNFSSFSVNGHSGLCIPGDSGVGFVQSFSYSGVTLNYQMALTVTSGVAGC